MNPKKLSTALMALLMTFTTVAHAGHDRDGHGDFHGGGQERHENNVHSDNPDADAAALAIAGAVVVGAAVGAAAANNAANHDLQNNETRSEAREYLAAVRERSAISLADYPNLADVARSRGVNFYDRQAMSRLCQSILE